MLTRLLTRMRDRRGFTLVETLVAMVTGIIVTGALFAILEVSLHQSSRLSDVAQSTQLGRTAMNRVIDAMHSACISEGFAPVQEKSTPSKLILVSGYSEATEVPTKATNATGVHKDEFEWNSTTKQLIDNSYLSTSEASAGKYNYEPVQKIPLAENVSQTNGEPIFRYFEYATTPATSTTAASSTLKEITPVTELSATQASKVASVAVAFNEAPPDKQTKLGRTVNLNSQVTFAFAAPNSEAKIEAAPCE
jgi:Tfp pilus assembly protein PilW